jgi:hypothetical protein
MHVCNFFLPISERKKGSSYCAKKERNKIKTLSFHRTSFPPQVCKSCPPGLFDPDPATGERDYKRLVATVAREDNRKKLKLTSR